MAVSKVAKRPSAKTARMVVGPAMVAGVAYLDPGNVATNLSAGANFGYLLIWVIVAANLGAVLVQYLAAKLGLVTGRSLPELLGITIKSRWAKRAFWLQALVVTMATDLAEILGGALGLHILFNLPLLMGSVLVAVASLALLVIQRNGKARSFELVMIGLIGVTAVGFVSGLFVEQPDPGQLLGGLVPAFDGTKSVVLASAIIGATIMPHAVYAHSALSRDRFANANLETDLSQKLRSTRWDVAVSMFIAGAVNLGILLVGAGAVNSSGAAFSIESAYEAINFSMGHIIGIMFAIGLIASGLAASSVGAYAGGVVMTGLLEFQMPLLARRALTVVPALVLISLSINSTNLLVLSQVILSFGIPFALIPLVRLTSSKKLLGHYANRPLLAATGYALATLLSALNAYLIFISIG